jgi:ATP-binding cassette subfamily B protein
VLVDPKPFRTARRHMDAVPMAKWGAILASLATALLFVSQLPVIYLTIDHLVWKGAIPSYEELPPSRQKAFRAEWESRLASNEAVRGALARLGPTDTEWESRWQASVYEKLRGRIGPEAANAYLVLPAEGTGDRGHLTGNRLGILSLVAREQSVLKADVISWLARTMPWTWQPDAVANTTYLSGLFAVIALILLLHGFGMLTAEYFAAEVSLEVGMRLRRTLYAHATRLGLLTVKSSAAREAADLFTAKVETIQDGIRAWLRSNIAAPAMFLLLLVKLLATNLELTLCFLVAGALVWLVLGQYAARFARDGRFAARRTEARMAQMRESLSLLHLVKSYLMDRFSQTRLERQLTDYTRAEWRRLRGLALSRPALVSVVALTAVAVLYLAGRGVLLGHISLASLAVKILAFVFLAAAVRSWIAGRIRIRKAGEAAAAVAEFLDRRVDPGQAIDAEFLQPLRKKLEVVEASLRESGTGRMLLDGVSFAVPSGSRIAVVASDADEGRALLSLFGRFVEPTGGEVRIDGKNVRWVTLESLRTQVALISQPLTVFTDTVTNNIGCGDPSFPPPQVINAAKLAHAHQFVQRLPYGYETIVGDGGYALRPGEKLRIALARALLRDPSLIVVEEPSEAMDVDSQTLLDDTFERARGGRTLLFLTHREAVLRHADHVLVLHKGQIVAAGRHEDLMNTSELYRRLVFKELAASA